MKNGKDGVYNRFIKRMLDFLIAFFSLILLSPFLLILMIVGTIAMKGNPFFCQKRPGMIDRKTGKERIISIIKFRSMTNRRDEQGNLLPDSQRLTRYGRFLRSTSCDELPELLNILVGDLALVGPRPLLTAYLPYYTEQERHRHDVRPGLTGLAQISGRNNLGWDKRLQTDLDYVSQISFKNDVRIVVRTVFKVLKREDVAVQRIVPLDQARRSEVEIK